MTTETPQTQVCDLTEQQCAERLAGMFRDADVHPHWPAQTDEVAEVLRSGGAYDVSQELLEGWARSRSIGKVEIRSGKFSWSPSNMLAAAALANSARRWLLDPKHIPKMTGPEILNLQAAAIGESLFTDLADVDLRSLIGCISGAEDRDLRSTLCVGLIEKLRHDGVIQ